MTADRIPLISVCIPTYRGAQFISAAIESVLAQSFGDFELLVLDDNSPDDTAQIAENYRDDRIKVSRSTFTLGPEGNWNRCLAAARGRYLKLLPQDDLLAPNCLEAQAKILELDTEHDLSLVFCARRVIDHLGQQLLTRGLGARAVGRIPARNLVHRCVRRGANLIGEPGAVLFRRELVTQAGSFDAQAPYVIDLDYWSRLLRFGNAYYLNEPLASFRLSGNQWTADLRHQQADDFVRWMQGRDLVDFFRIRVPDLLLGRCMAHAHAKLRMIYHQHVMRSQGTA